MEVGVEGEIIFWRGPAPYLFVPLEAPEADAVASIAREVTYGWGAIPAEVRLRGTVWRTSLFPREGTYLVPVKVAVQRAEDVGVGDRVRLRVRILTHAER